MQYRGIVRVAQVVQSLPLARRELAAAADGKAPEPQGAELDAPEAQHRMAQGLAVALDLAIAPLGERDLELLSVPDDVRHAAPAHAQREVQFLRLAGMKTGPYA